MIMETKLVTINDIYTALVKGVNFDKSDASMSKTVNYTPLLRANNISDMRINLDGLMYVKSNLVKKEQHLRDGDIVFVTSSGSKHLVGKSALVSDLPKDITIGAFNSLLRFSEDIEPRYVFYALNSPLFKTHMASRLAGANINNIKKNDVLDFELIVPFNNGKPDFAEQKSIADRLDKVLAEIERAAAVNERQKQYTEMTKHSFISDGFFGKVRSKKMKLEDVINPVSVQVKPKDFGDVPYVGLEHINSFEISLKNTGLPSQVRSAKWKFQANDILYGKLRPYLNKCVVADTEGICSTDILVLRAEENIVPKYVAYLMSSRDFIEYANGTVSGMNLPRTTWSKVKNYEIDIPVDSKGNPDRKEQQNIVDAIDKGFALSEKLKSLFVRQETSFTSLRASVLNQSFQPATEAVLMPIVSPIQLATPRMFDIQQAVAQILNRFERGEMVVAKVLYIGQEVFGVPTNIQFSAQNFGPYDTAVKKAVTAGLSPKNKFFTKKGYGTSQVLALGVNASKILRYSTSALAKKTNAYLDIMLPHYTASDSTGIERLATVCKIIEDERTTDETIVKMKLQEWKQNKFSEGDVSRTLAFITKQGWDKKLIK